MPNNDVRNVYEPVADRHVIRTADVYQTQTENGTVGYSDTLLAVVANFRNSGIPAGCNARGMAGKSKRGEVACQIFGAINAKTGRIDALGFKSRGCIAMTACASQLCTLASGKTIAEAQLVTAEQLKRSLDGVPGDKSDVPIFAVEALHAMVGDYLLHTGGLDALQAGLSCNESSIDCILCEHCSLRDLRVDAYVCLSPHTHRRNACRRDFRYLSRMRYTTFYPNKGSHYERNPCTRLERRRRRRTGTSYRRIRHNPCHFDAPGWAGGRRCRADQAWQTRQRVRACWGWQ